MREEEIKEQFQLQTADRKEQAGKLLTELHRKNGEVYKKEFRQAM